MEKKEYNIKILIRKNLDGFLADRGIKRVCTGSIELIENYFFKELENLSEQFREEMLVSCKRTLDRDVVKNVLERN